MMEPKQIFIAVTLTSGQVAVLGFFTVQRGPTLPDGAVWLDIERGIWGREPTPENLASEILRVYPNPAKYRVMSDEEAEAHHLSGRNRDRQFRDALVDDGKALVHDMVKARDILRDQLRVARVPLFDENDLVLQDALVSEDKVALQAATARRDQLRDITDDPRIESAQTVEDLKAITVE